MLKERLKEQFCDEVPCKTQLMFSKQTLPFLLVSTHHHTRHDFG